MINQTQELSSAALNLKTKTKKKAYTPQFKFDRAMEAIKNQSQIATLSRQYNISAKLFYLWRAQLLERGSKIFETMPDHAINELKQKVAQLEQMVGKKEIELALLKNFSDFYQSKNTS